MYFVIKKTLSNSYVSALNVYWYNTANKIQDRDIGTRAGRQRQGLYVQDHVRISKEVHELVVMSVNTWCI